MSGQATGWVLRHGPKDRAMRAVLITIADAANRDGTHAFPGVEAMVEGSGYCRSSVFAALRRLVDEGWVEVEGSARGPGARTTYRVITERVQPLDSFDTESVQRESRESPERVQTSPSTPYIGTGTKNGNAPPTPAHDITCVWWERFDPHPTMPFIAAKRIFDELLKAFPEDRVRAVAKVLPATFQRARADEMLRGRANGSAAMSQTVDVAGRIARGEL